MDKLKFFTFFKKDDHILALNTFGMYQSTNGIDFFPFVMGSRSSSGNVSAFTEKGGCTDLYDNSALHSYVFVEDKNSGKKTLTFDGQNYKEIRRIQSNLTAGKLVFHKHPVVRRPEYLFKISKGKYLYVSADLHNFEYETMKMFIGPLDRMKLVPIKKVDRMRDGGTTYIRTDKGDMYSPAPIFKDSSDKELRKKKPTWMGQRIKRRNPKKYEIKENAKSVVITKLV